MKRHAHPVLLVLTLLSLPSCGDGKKDDPLAAAFRALPQATAVSYQPGTEHIVVEATFDATGGTLEGPTGTPVEGVVITVPPGALTAPTTLGLGYDDGTFVNLPADKQNVVLVLRSGGADQFEQPLTVTFPFTNPDRFPVSFYIDPSGRLEIVASLPFDRASGRAGFYTWHASNYTWLNADPSSPKPTWNKFDPDLDGFDIENDLAVKYASNGRCWGIIDFAKWFKLKRGGGLFSQFQTPVQTQVGDQQRAGQELIATRAHNSVVRYQKANQLPPWPEGWTDQDMMRQFLIEVREALADGAVAVGVGLGKPGGEHAVLAIGFSDNQIALYDPNHPGAFKAMDYTLDPPNVAYGEYWDFGVFKNAEMRRYEEYDHLLEDANATFNNENETWVEVTSHTDGETVSGEDILIEGKVHSGQVLIEELEARVVYDDLTVSEPYPFTMPKGDDGFQIPLKLREGGNAITFDTKGYVAYLGTQNIPNRPSQLTLQREDTQLPQSLISITSTRTDQGTTGRVEVSVTYSAHVVFQTKGGLILQPGFDFTQCDGTNMACDIVTARTMDSLDVLTANPVPVTVSYHIEVYEQDFEGNEVLVSYGDANGQLTCNLLSVRMFVEPGGTTGSHQYRLTVLPTGGCVEGVDLTPMIEGKYKFNPTDTEWHDATPEMLTLYTGFPGSLELEHPIVDVCEQPALIPSANVEPWVSTPTGAKTWTSLAGFAGCDLGGTTRTESASVSLTLVP